MSLYIFKARVKKNGLVKILTSWLLRINTYLLSLVLPTNLQSGCCQPIAEMGKLRLPEQKELVQERYRWWEEENSNSDLSSSSLCCSQSFQGMWIVFLKWVCVKTVEDMAGRKPQAACSTCLGGTSVLEEQQPQSLLHPAEPTEIKNSKRKHPLSQEPTSATTETNHEKEK